MISNQIMQSTLDGLKKITREDFWLFSPEGNLLVATNTEDRAEKKEIQSFSASPADSQVIGEVCFFKVYDEHQLMYVLLSGGKGDPMIGQVAAYQLQSLLVAYKERFDKDNFIKNLLLDNLLLVDIYNRAKKLHISPDTKRVVFIL